jgi:hypothetical protein
MTSPFALKDDRVLSSGLGSFNMDEADIDAYEKSTGDAGGIADLGPIRERLIQASRFDDDNVAHVATGELVVPKPLIDKFPELKESIFQHLREMGVEDPERYLVGNEENSINPETGLPEFGFFSSVGKAIKSAVKSVAKVVKKVAPTIIKIGGTILLTPVMGPIAAAAISSGISTLVAGGSLKDAAISAALGGATGALTPSLGAVAANALTGGAEAAIKGGDFGDVLKSAAISAGSAAAGKLIAPTVSNALEGTAAGDLLDMQATPQTGFEALSEDVGKLGTSFDQMAQGEFGKAFAPTAQALGFGTVEPALSAMYEPAGLDQIYADEALATGPYVEPVTAFAPTAQALGSGTPAGLDQIYADEALATGRYSAEPGFIPRNFPETTAAAEAFLTNVEEKPFQTLLWGESKLTPEQELAMKAQIRTELAGDTKYAGASPADVTKAVEARVAEAQPSRLARNPYLLTLGIPAAAAAASMLSKVPPTEKPDILPSEFAGGPSAEMIEQYRLGQSSLFPTWRPTTTLVPTSPTSYGYSPYLRQRRPQMYAAEGGEVYPRRNGGIMPNEGVPDRDSVRALLMPGEFVMTKEAVRGAGNGNLNRGINNMYSVMRRLETRGRRTA